MHFLSEKNLTVIKWHIFCKRPVLIYLHASELFMFLFSSADFFKIDFFLK